MSGPNGTRDLATFYAAWGQVVFVPVLAGSKVCKQEDWSKLTYEETQTPEYQAKLAHGNLGVVTGPASGNLVAVDLDSKEACALWLEANPWSAHSRQVVTSRGRRYYFRMVGPYPGNQNFGNKQGEWLVVHLSVIDGWAKDEDKKPFTYSPDTQDILEVPFERLAWPGKFERPEIKEEEESSLKLELLSVDELPAIAPPFIFEGLLRVGQVMLMGGHSKSWKSFALRDMYYCAANGLPWLGFEAPCPHRVIDIDLECEAWDLRSRYEEIRKSYRTGDFSNLLIIPMRGKSLSLSNLADLAEQIRATDFGPSLLGLDPIYRLLASNENDTEAVTDLMNKFLRLGCDLLSAIVLSQHFSKGAQADKDSIDRFSGTGVWGRHPDVLAPFTEHEEQDSFTVEFTVRSGKKPDPFVVHFDYPRFRIKENADPENLKRVKPGPKKKYDLVAFCSLLPRDDTETYTNFRKRSELIMQMSARTFDRRLKECQECDWIYSVPPGKYGVTQKFLSDNP